MAFRHISKIRGRRRGHPAVHTAGTLHRQRHLHHVVHSPQSAVKRPPIPAAHRQRRHQALASNEPLTAHGKHEVRRQSTINTQIQAISVVHQHQYPIGDTLHYEPVHRQRTNPRPPRITRQLRKRTHMNTHPQNTRQHHHIRLRLRLNSPQHRLNLRCLITHQRTNRTLTHHPVKQRRHPIHEQLAPNRRRHIQKRRLRRTGIGHQHRQRPLTTLRQTPKHPIPRNLRHTRLRRIPTQQHPTLNRHRRQTRRRTHTASSTHTTRRHHHQHRRQHTLRKTQGESPALLPPKPRHPSPNGRVPIPSPPPHSSRQLKLGPPVPTSRNPHRTCQDRAPHCE